MQVIYANRPRYTRRGRKVYVNDRIFSEAKYVHSIRVHRRCVVHNGHLQSISGAGIARQLRFQKMHFYAQKKFFAEVLMKDLKYVRHIVKMHKEYVNEGNDP